MDRQRRKPSGLGSMPTPPPLSHGELKRLNKQPLPDTFENCWGEHLTLDAIDCNKENIQNPDYLSMWVKDLVKKINMVAYGEPQIVHFGKGDPKLAGWTVVQLIETSNIIAHFNDLDGSACIDVFSCKPFDPNTVLDHIVLWFDPEEISTNLQKRLDKAS